MSLVIQEMIAKAIAHVTLSPKVLDAVVEAVVGKAVAKQSDAIVKGLDDLKKLENELKKLGFDMVQYGEDENKANAIQSYTKARFEERSKLRERITKLTNTLTKAIEKGDYGDLYNHVGGKKDQTDGKPTEDKSGTAES